MLNTFYFACRALWRDWRAGQWLIIFTALVLAITALTSVHFYIDRLLSGIDQQGAKILGGDLVVSSNKPILPEWKEKAKQLHLRIAEVWSFPTVANREAYLHLVNLQAVSETYPLYSEASFSLQPKTIAIEPRLLPLLQTKINDVIKIGAADFQIKNLLTADMDSLNTSWNIAPRVMVRLRDLSATKTVVPGSRVDYRLLLAGDPKSIERFKQWITPQLQPAQRVIDLKNQQYGPRIFIERAEQYVQLILLVCLLMSGVAIALGIRQYIQRHFNDVAMWRCLGAKQSDIIAIFCWQLLCIAGLAGALAVSLGFISQFIFAHIFYQYWQFTLPTASMQPVLIGFGFSILLLFAFAFPVIETLARTSPLYIWRDVVAFGAWRNNFYMLGAIFFIFVAFEWVMHFSQLATYFLAGIIVSVVLLYQISLIILCVVRKLIVFTNGTIRQGFNQLLHHQKSISLQFVAFNLIVIALLVASDIRHYLIIDWQKTLPPSTPNYFAFNIAAADLPNVKNFLIDHRVQIDGIYPMIMGRLILMNGKPILSAIPLTGKNHNALHRDLNLSWMEQFPSDNKVVVGPNWDTIKQPLAVSVEKFLADALQLHLGDELTFQISERKVTVTVANMRTVAWSSFHPNFYFIFKPGILRDLPTTYITSFHLAPEQSLLINQLIQQFPNITVIDVANLLAEIRGLIDKIVYGIQYLFLFALGAGALIFLTSLRASMDERRRTYRLLRVLGASKRYIRKSLLVEFITLAVLIAFSSVVLAKLIAYFLQIKIFGV